MLASPSPETSHPKIQRTASARIGLNWVVVSNIFSFLRLPGEMGENPHLVNDLMIHLGRLAIFGHFGHAFRPLQYQGPAPVSSSIDRALDYRFSARKANLKWK